MKSHLYHTTDDYTGKTFNKLSIIRQFIGYHNKTMVECVCKCGNIKQFQLSYVKNNFIHSCGCSRVESNQHTNSAFKRKSYGEAAFNQVYSGYKGNAKHGRSGVREFKLTKDDAMKLFKSNCFYCNKIPSKIRINKKLNGEFIYNGIDRKDNTKGYTLENCVTCCEFCNLNKSDTSFKDFINWIRTVYNNTKNINI